ncbi:MAG: hypothetical protein H7301_08705 [Cryobacterium sp.]|nr:hypothetical protein [Oligoflexia bacterium]
MELCEDKAVNDEKTPNSNPSELRDRAPGVDTYIDPDSGFTVFTREFHERRGRCCQSRCRHCPYGFNPDAIPTPEWVNSGEKR